MGYRHQNPSVVRCIGADFAAEVAAQVDYDWLIRLRCVNCQRLGSTEFDLIDLAVGYFVLVGGAHGAVERCINRIRWLNSEIICDRAFVYFVG